MDAAGGREVIAMTRRCAAAVGAVVLASTLAAGRAAVPDAVDLTWMSISNMYYEIGPLKILTDGYITRLPQDAFYGGGGGLAKTRQPFKPDLPAITRVFDAIGGKGSIDLLLTGHSHFDHSFDTAAWSTLSGARIIGSKTTCLQAVAQRVPADRCRAVDGGEAIALADGVTMRVIRWNHSGDPRTNPEQHDAIELETAPVPDPQSGGLRAGVAEDFPNGGGNRAYLFVVDGPSGRLSWFFNNSASAVDLETPIVVAGRNHGAPLANLEAAMRAAKLDAVDLWIGAGGTPIASKVVPVIKPRYFLPVHWDGLWGAFAAGVPAPYRDPALEAFLEKAGVRLVRPVQYMDKWRLSRDGVQAVANPGVKKALGF